MQIALEHELFTERTRESIYPDSRRRYDFLRFFGLWNRAVAELLIRSAGSGEVGVYHCTDYHGGLAPLYVEEWGAPLVPVALTLHNALYQGGMLSVLSADEWAAVAKTLQLRCVRRHADAEGDFNMLQAAVSYMREHQAGVGVTAVSNQYAANLRLTMPLLRDIPVEGHPNPNLDTDRPTMPAGLSLAEHKAASKARMQEALGLRVDPGALVIGFVGRLTFEKGADLMMEASFWMLSAFPSVQLYLVGPIGDEVGELVATRLALSSQVASIRERFFVATKFFPVTADMRYGEQVFEIGVPLDDVAWDQPGLGDRVRAAFHAQHIMLAGRSRQLDRF